MAYSHLTNDSLAGVYAYVARKHDEEPNVELWAGQLVELGDELDRRGIRSSVPEASPGSAT